MADPSTPLRRRPLGIASATRFRTTRTNALDMSSGARHAIHATQTYAVEFPDSMTFPPLSSDQT